MDISVVIPTYNRKDILKKTLHALLGQDYPKDKYEIVVVDDGSRDGTEEMVRSILPDNPAGLRLNYKYHENRGPAATRNLGIRMSKGEVILFLGDDIFARDNLLSEHMRVHNASSENTAVLGYVTWDPRIKQTHFLKYVIQRGLDFQYERICDPENVSYRHFYTCNISLRKSFLLRKGLFDEDFRVAIWEDVDLGYRLVQEGLRIKYNPEAFGYHYHPTTVKSRCHLIFLSGFYSVVVEKKHPGVFSIPTLPPRSLNDLIKDVCYPLAVHPVSFLDYYLGLNLNFVYGRLLDFYKMKGYRKGLHHTI